MFAVCRRQGEPQYSMMNIASHIFEKNILCGEFLIKKKTSESQWLAGLCF